MNKAAFQLIASGVALGIMGGAVGLHRLHLSGAGEWSGGAGLGAPGPAGEISGAAYPRPMSADSATFEPGAANRPAFGAEEQTKLDLLKEMVSRLEKLQDGQDSLRSQQAETNRDLNVLELRTDSLSLGFRPLPSSGFGGIRRGSVAPGSILEPFAPSGEVHSLLPPKQP